MVGRTSPRRESITRARECHLQIWGKKVGQTEKDVLGCLEELSRWAMKSFGSCCRARAGPPKGNHGWSNVRVVDAKLGVRAYRVLLTSGEFRLRNPGIA